MVEIKVEAENTKDSDARWNIGLYTNDKFIKTICTCYEEDYALIVGAAIAEKVGAVLKY